MFHGYLVFGSSAQALCHSEHPRHTSAAFAWWRASFGTLPQRFHVGIHHGPRTMSNTYSTHRHQCASCASRQRPTWPATCASIKHLCNGGERRKTHASSCISLSNPMVRSTSALYRSARLPYLAPAPGSRVPAPSAQKIKRQLCLAEICPAVTQ